MTKLTFKTKQDAIDYLTDEEGFELLEDGVTFMWGGTYYLKHGEYAQPEYCVRRYKDGWGIKAVYHYYAGTFNAPKDGRVYSF